MNRAPWAEAQTPNSGFPGKGLTLFVETRDPERLKKDGVRIGSFTSGLATAFVLPSMLESLVSDPSISYTEAGGVCVPLLDRSLPSIGMDGVRSGVHGIQYLGRGTVIGFVDSGIDWSHADFIAEDNTSRILFLWDQTDSRGPVPSGFGYGTEYSRTQINDEIDGTPAGVVLENDKTGHGTHVAGIAAANGRATGNSRPSGVYEGVAPQADLIVVKAGDSDFPEIQIVDGVRYIFRKAAEIGMPAVVNLSVGKRTHEGPHDGSSLFERSLDDLLWEKGRALVVAAGNDGGKNLHFKGEFVTPTSESSMTAAFRVGQNRTGLEDFIRFDVWSPPVLGLSVAVITPSGNTAGPVTPRSPVWAMETSEGIITIDNASTGPDPNNDDLNMRIRISDFHAGSVVTDLLAAGSWQLRFSGKVGRFDGWLAETTVDAEVTGPVDASTLLVEPGTTHWGITVGSFVSRTDWPSLLFDPWGPGGLTVGALSSFSSPGSARPNSRNSHPRAKPELVAPGEYVLSALSSRLAPAPDDQFVATDGVHWAAAGTSMSAPHVAGVVALMFEADPTLDATQVKSLLIRNTGKPAAMGGANWDKTWGYGKLDAYAVMLETGVERSRFPVQPSGFSMSANYPNPFNGSTRFSVSVPAMSSRSSDALVRVCDAAGRTVRVLLKGPMRAGTHMFLWDGKDGTGAETPSGLYVAVVYLNGGVMACRKLCRIR